MTSRVLLTTPEAGYRIHYCERPALQDLPGLDATWSLRLGPELGSLEHRPASCTGVQVIYDLVRRRLWIKGAHVRTETTQLVASSRYCGLRLRPIAATWLIGEAAFELRNRVLPWREVTADPWWQAMASALEGADTAHRALETLVDHLRRRPLPPVDHVAARARQLVDARTLGDPSQDAAGSSRLVDGVARAVGLSPRQLLRRFSRAIGLGLKAYQQTLRVSACARRMLSEPTADLASIAHAGGFADQAHLTRQFRAHAGMTPAKYRSRYDRAERHPSGTIRHIVV